MMKYQTPVFCIVLVMLCFAAGIEKAPAEDTAKKPAAVVEKAAAPVAKESREAAKPFKDDPAARAIYKKMIEAMRKADTLSYVAHYTIQGKGDYKSGSTYRAWLKKPNYFRVEAESDLAGKMPRRAGVGGGGGVLIGDGHLLWIYWPNGRYMRPWEDAKEFEKARLTTYIKKAAPRGGHSIGHEVCCLGAGTSMPVIDPSTFHGYTDSLQQYLDGVMGLGSEKVGDEDCDKVEVSIMKRQRSWYLWLSNRDHLPRKMKEIVRVSFDLIITEDWSSVKINGDIPDKMFAWRPPKDWTQWIEPPLEIGLLKPGTKAPNFDLASADGGQIKLSDYRGQIVWLNVWRAG